MTLSHRDFTDLLEVADERVLEVLARDEDLPSAHYELLVQLANGTVAGTLLQNYSVPESALRLLLERFPEYEDMVRAHPDSPDDWKLDLLNEHVTTEALTRFFRRMKATRSERDRMLRRWSKDGQRRFGDCWAEVRPGPDPDAWCTYVTVTSLARMPHSTACRRSREPVFCSSPARWYFTVESSMNRVCGHELD